MNKRVHEIAKERGLPAKEVLAKLKAAGIEVKAASSSVDETVALRPLDNGDTNQPSAAPPAEPKKQAAKRASAEPAAPPKPASEAKPPTDGDRPQPQAAGQGERAGARPEHKRPTRDSLQGERAPGSAGGRRRVVIDSRLPAAPKAARLRR